MIAAEDYVNYFASDRSHMFPAGARVPPPPTYPPIQGPLAINSMNLESYINIDPPELVDFDATTDRVGVVLERHEFELWSRQLFSRFEAPNEVSSDTKAQEAET